MESFNKLTENTIRKKDVYTKQTTLDFKNT